MKLLPIAAAVSVALLSSNVLAEDDLFHGYMRAGVGMGSETGANAKWQEFKVGRLGNENDFYGEFGFYKDLYKHNDVTFRVESMLSFWDNAFSEGDGTNTDVAQFNIQAKGLFDFDKEAVLWAGKRFYQRHDIHITDFYYWNTSNLGGGIEQIQMGPGRLSVAVLQDGGAQDIQEQGGPDSDPRGITAFIGDVRYAGIPLWKDADLELGINYNYANERNNQDVVADDGVMGTAILTQSFDGGFNKTVLQGGNNGYGAQMVQYGAGAGYFRADADDSSDDNRNKIRTLSVRTEITQILLPI